MRENNRQVFGKLSVFVNPFVDDVVFFCVAPKLYIRITFCEFYHAFKEAEKRDVSASKIPPELVSVIIKGKLPCRQNLFICRILDEIIVFSVDCLIVCIKIATTLRITEALFVAFTIMVTSVFNGKIEIDNLNNCINIQPR